MPIQVDLSDDRILVVHISGNLIKADYQTFGPEFERRVREHGKLRVLFDITGLHGWDVGAFWEDIKFDVKHFDDIERLAMVGEKRWQHTMAAIFSPFTKAETRYFDHTAAAEARQWLREP